MFFSNREVRDLVWDIVTIVLFLVIIIPICVSASNNYNNKEVYTTTTKDLYADLAENPDKDTNYKVISDKIVTIGTKKENSFKVSIVFKVQKFKNDYTLVLDDKSYDLGKTDYVEDKGYLYYNLGTFDIDKESKMNFKLIMNNDISLDDSVSYSFLVEGI